MPGKAIALASADDWGAAGFSWDHPLATAAAEVCQQHSTALPDLLGAVACRLCWARAASDAGEADLALALEFELPLEIAPDPSYVDEVAVERALNGRPVNLTVAEHTEVARRQAARRARRRTLRTFRCAVAAVTR